MSQFKFNLNPDYQRLGELVRSPDLAAQLAVCCYLAWDKKDLCRQMTDPDGAVILAGSLMANVGVTTGIYDAAAICALYGAIVGHRDDELAEVGPEGVSLARAMLQPEMPNINDLLQGKLRSDDFYLVDRSRMALEFVLHLVGLSA